MRASNNAINLITKYEGCRLKAYKCPAGVWTIGYGHTNGVKQGQTITKEQAIKFLKSDITKYEEKVNVYNPAYNFNQNEFDALVSFAFNIGSIDQLTNHGTRTKKQISEKIILYNKASGKVLNGLTKRRKEEQALFNKVIEVNITKVAQDVINGKYGNGIARKNALKNAGYNYEEVQKEVNRILRG